MKEAATNQTHHGMRPEDMIFAYTIRDAHYRRDVRGNRQKGGWYRGQYENYLFLLPVYIPVISSLIAAPTLACCLGSARVAPVQLSWVARCAALAFRAMRSKPAECAFLSVSSSRLRPSTGFFPCS